MPAISPLKFIQQAEKKPPAACLLCGEEVQLVEEVRAAVCRHFPAAARQPVELERQQPNAADIFQGKGLFDDSAQLYLLSGSGRPPSPGLELIESLRQRVQPPDCLMVVLREWDYKYKKAAWFKKLSELLPAVICDRQSAPEAVPWIERFAREAGVSLTAETARFLSVQTEGNLFAARQSIRKLALAAADGGSPADERALRQTLADGARYDILDLSDAIYAGDAQRAIAVLQTLHADGVAEVLIQWAVATVLGNIAAAKHGGQIMAWGKQQAAVRALADRISDAYLQQLVRQAAYADRVTKGVAHGDSKSIIGGIVARLAARQSGARITLPYHQPSSP